MATVIVEKVDGTPGVEERNGARADQGGRVTSTIGLSHRKRNNTGENHNQVQDLHQDNLEHSINRK